MSAPQQSEFGQLVSRRSHPSRQVTGSGAWSNSVSVISKGGRKNVGAGFVPARIAERQLNVANQILYRASPDPGRDKPSPYIVNDATIFCPPVPQNRIWPTAVTPVTRKLSPLL